MITFSHADPRNAATGYTQCGLGGVELSEIAKEQDLIAGLEFFVGSGIDQAGAVALDAHDAGAGARAQLQFANEFPGGG